MMPIELEDVWILTILWVHLLPLADHRVHRVPRNPTHPMVVSSNAAMTKSLPLHLIVNFTVDDFFKKMYVSFKVAAEMAKSLVAVHIDHADADAFLCNALLFPEC